MIRYKAHMITANGAEVIEDSLEGREDVDRKVLAIGFEQDAGSECTAYFNTDQIAVLPSEVAQLDYHWADLDVELGPGDTFKVGHNETAGSSTDMHILVKYEETPQM